MRRAMNGHKEMSKISQQYEQIDAEVFGICKKAEKICQPSWAGKYEWSPKLSKAIKQINYWQHRLRYEQETNVIKKLGSDLEIPYVELSECTIHQMLNDSKKALREVQEKSRKYRQDHLETLARQYATQNRVSTQTAILELLAHEDARHTFRSLKTIKENKHSKLLALWEAVDDEGEFIKDEGRKRIYVDREAVHRALLWHNARHLGQASDTPFARGFLEKETGNHSYITLRPSHRSL